MKKSIFSVLLVLLMAAVETALAGHGVYHVDYTDEASRSVVLHYEKKWPGYVLENYLHLEGGDVLVFHG